MIMMLIIAKIIPSRNCRIILFPDPWKGFFNIETNGISIFFPSLHSRIRNPKACPKRRADTNPAIGTYNRSIIGTKIRIPGNHSNREYTSVFVDRLLIESPSNCILKTSFSFGFTSNFESGSTIKKKNPNPPRSCRNNIRSLIFA